MRPQTEEEEELYRRLAEVTQKPASSLSSRWREPSLTVHNIQISGPRSTTDPFSVLSCVMLIDVWCSDATVIPGTVKAQLSLRIVPDQGLDRIIESLRGHLNG